MDILKTSIKKGHFFLFQVLFMILLGFKSFGQADSTLALDSNPLFGAKATFKSIRPINFHTVETLRKGSLELRILHRFGSLNSGLNNFYGVDGPTSTRIGLDYGLQKNLEVGHWPCF